MFNFDIRKWGKLLILTMVAQASGTKSLKEYLKRYETNTEEEQKKKRKKKKVKPDGPGVLVLDEDPVWQKPVKLEEEEDNDSAGKISHYPKFDAFFLG